MLRAINRDRFPILVYLDLRVFALAPGSTVILSSYDEYRSKFLLLSMVCVFLEKLITFPIVANNITVEFHMILFIIIIWLLPGFAFGCNHCYQLICNHGYQVIYNQLMIVVIANRSHCRIIVIFSSGRLIYYSCYT